MLSRNFIIIVTDGKLNLQIRNFDISIRNRVRKKRKTGLVQGGKEKLTPAIMDTAVGVSQSTIKTRINICIVKNPG